MATREDGSTIAPNDPFWDALGKAANAAKRDPQAWLEQAQFYGNLGQNPRFAKTFGHWLRLIWDQGTEAALRSYLES